MRPAGGGRRANWLQAHALWAYFPLTYAISWSIGITVVLAVRGRISGVSPALHYFFGFGPLLSAVIITWLTEGRRGVGALLGRLARWRVGAFWWIVAISPLVLYALVALVQRVVTGTWPDAGLLGQVNFLPRLSLPAALLLWFVTYGIGEEVGWRGFALPRLQRRRSALASSVILWVFWATWHWPGFLYLPNYAFIPGIVLGILAGAIVYTWIYNGSGGSLLIAAAFHATFNFITASKAAAGLAGVVLTVVVMVAAVVIIAVYRGENLASQRKQVAP